MVPAPSASSSYDDFDSLAHTPTWAVGVVCIIIVILSLLIELALKALNAYFDRHGHTALRDTLERLKEDVMQLGFISLMMVVTRDSLSKICIPEVLSDFMLPCSYSDALSTFPFDSDQGLGDCKPGQMPLMTTESLHQLHMFIFVLAIVHIWYSCLTMSLARLQTRWWSLWEEQCRGQEGKEKVQFLLDRVKVRWTSRSGLSWIDSFFRQFWHPVKKSDYVILRVGFIKNHNASPIFNFFDYLTRVMEDEFKTIVGISAHLWLFVILFMVLNIHGWYTHFWVSFVPFLVGRISFWIVSPMGLFSLLQLLLLVGAKLQHVITSLALEVVNRRGKTQESVRPRDELFWFNSPRFLLHLMHFILFQNSCELAYFFWAWSTFGLHSCFMGRRSFVYARILLGFLSQISCGYMTLPLYALVTQMGSSCKIKNPSDWLKPAINLPHIEGEHACTQQKLEALEEKCEKSLVIETDGTVSSTIPPVKETVVTINITT